MSLNRVTKTNHTHDYESTWHGATYFAKGYTNYKCTICGHSYNSNYTSVLVLSTPSNTINDEPPVPSEEPIERSLTPENPELKSEYTVSDDTSNGSVAPKSDDTSNSSAEPTSDDTSNVPAVSTSDVTPSSQISETEKKIETIENETSKASVVQKPERAKIKSVKNSKKKSVVLKLVENNGAKGYQIQYSTNKKFKNKKSKIMTKTNITVKKLKKAKTYYFRVRAYVLDQNGKKVYGKWSNIKKVKIKK